LAKQAAQQHVPLAYHFAFEANGEDLLATFFIKFNVERFAYPGSEFSSTPSGSTLLLVSKSHNSDHSVRNMKISLDADETMQFLAIIGRSEIFSLPPRIAGPEPRDAVVGGYVAQFERFYNGQTVFIDRVPLASLPAEQLVSRLYEFIRSLVQPKDEGKAEGARPNSQQSRPGVKPKGTGLDS
jgi:hypothetical protein